MISAQVPSYVAYQQTPLQTFWPVVLLYVGIVEIFSVFTFENPFGKGGFWTLKDDRVRRPRPRLRELGAYLVLQRHAIAASCRAKRASRNAATRNDVVRLVDWRHAAASRVCPFAGARRLRLGPHGHVPHGSGGPHRNADEGTQ